MEDFIINLNFIKGEPRQFYEETEMYHPSSKGMYWCMMATKFHRIFNRQDMEEFLFRLAIVLDAMNLTENWLTNCNLMTYNVDGKSYTFTINDIINHFGIEVINSVDNAARRECFMENFGNNLKEASILGFINGFSVIPFIKKGEHEFKLALSEYTPVLTESLLGKADFFVKDALKFFPVNVFTDRHENMAAKEAEIQERKEAIKKLPVFDIKKIPSDTIRQCLMIMFAEDFVVKILNDADEFNKTGKPYIYLAWLWANDLMFSFGPDFDPVEGIYFNYEDYELEDGGFNLSITIEDYNIEDTVTLLKGVGI